MKKHLCGAFLLCGFGRLLRASTFDLIVGDTGLVWRVAYCEPRHEFLARDILVDRGYGAFLPFMRFIKRVKMRNQSRYNVSHQDRPLFPRYLFVDAVEASATTGVRGVLGLLSAGECILSVPDVAMGRLRAMASPSGMMNQVDITRLKYDFEGKVGDEFRFSENSTMFGLTGVISSIDRLDDTGTIKAWVKLLGSTREAVVSHKAVGEILQSSDCRIPMAEAA